MYSTCWLTGGGGVVLMNSHIIRRGAMAVLVPGAVILLLNSCLLLAARAACGAYPRVMTPGETMARTVTIPDIIPESFVMPAAGAALYLLMRAITAVPWGPFVTLVLLVAAAWTFGPVMHGADLCSKLVLSLTHAVIAATVLVTTRIYLWKGGIDGP